MFRGGVAQAFPAWRRAVIIVSVFAISACPAFRRIPRPACGPLLPCVTDGFFNAVHYPGGSVVIAAFPGAFRETHEAFPLFQDAAGFSIGQDRFLFRRQLHFSRLFRLSIFLLISFQLLPMEPVHISLTMEPSYIASMCMASIFKWAFHTLRPYFLLLAGAFIQKGISESSSVSTAASLIFVQRFNCFCFNLYCSLTIFLYS